MASFLNPITSLLGAGANIYGLLQGGQQQQWQNDFQINQLNALRQAMGLGQDMWFNNANPARDNALSSSNLLSQYLFGGGDLSQSPLFQMGDKLLGNGPKGNEKFMGDPYDMAMNPQLAELITMQHEANNRLNPLQETANNVFQGGGWTPARQDLQDNFLNLSKGATDAQRNLANTGNRILDGEGGTDFTRNTADRGIDVLNSGGWTDPTKTGYDAATGLLGQGGQTDLTKLLAQGGMGMFGNQGFNGANSSLFNTGQQGLQGGALGTAGLTQAGGMAEMAGLMDVLQGGQSDLSNSLAGRGLDLAGREALLPDEMVYNIAREGAANSASGAFKRAQRAALARGGQAASSVAAGGAQDDPMSEWSSQAMQAVSDAGRQALLAQQGLKLKQMETGAGMAGQAGGLENSRYGMASDLVKGMEGNATNRYMANAGIAGNALQNALGYANLGSETAMGAQDQETKRFLSAMGIMPGLSDSMANYAGTYGNMGIGATNAANNKLAIGGDLISKLMNSQIGSGGVAENNATNQGQYTLGAGNLGMNSNNSQSNNLQSLMQNWMGLGQFGLNRANLGMAGTQQNTDNSMNFMNFMNNMYNSGQNNLLNMAGMGQSYAQSGLTGQPSNFQLAFGQSNPGWSNIANGLGNINFGNIFGNGGGKQVVGGNLYNPHQTG